MKKKIEIWSQDLHILRFTSKSTYFTNPTPLNPNPACGSYRILDFLGTQKSWNGTNEMCCCSCLDSLILTQAVVFAPMWMHRPSAIACHLCQRIRSHSLVLLLLVSNNLFIKLDQIKFENGRQLARVSLRQWRQLRRVEFYHHTGWGIWITLQTLGKLDETISFVSILV